MKASNFDEQNSISKKKISDNEILENKKNSDQLHSNNNEIRPSFEMKPSLINNLTILK